MLVLKKIKITSYALIRIFIILTVFSSFASILIGAKGFSLRDLIACEPMEVMLFLVSRLPRTLTIILTGIGLSVSGLVMQQITQNKFVSPTTAGTLEGSKLGILLSVILIPSAGMFVKSLFAFAFTFAVSLIFLKMVNKVRFRNVIFIPIVGLLFGGIINSVSTFFAVNFNIVQSMNTWLVGDFSGILQGRYELMYLTIPPVIATYFYANRFTAAGMGKDFSQNIGLNYNAVIFIGMLLISITLAVTTLTAGSITFVGLVAPNIISMMYGDHTRKTLPVVALFGALLLLFCDVAGRLIIFPFEVPIGVTVGITGGLVFLLLILRKK